MTNEQIKDGGTARRTPTSTRNFPAVASAVLLAVRATRKNQT